MVQLKYFGDSRDYFKYDLITHLLANDIASNYVFVPMLTNHRIDAEGNKSPRYINGKSRDLLSFIESCGSKDLEHWEKWINPYVKSYVTIKPVNEVYFSDNTRNNYWETFESIIKTKNALIFIDPDTGLETGKPSYLKKMGREKYILDKELATLSQSMDSSSVMMIYQHLPNNKHIHQESVNKKINQAIQASGYTSVLAYREDDLAFLFLTKNKKVFSKLGNFLERYCECSSHTYKSMHYPPKEQLGR